MPIAKLTKNTQSVVVSYHSIRQVIGYIGLALPVVLGPLGWLIWGIEIQDNLSSYYHSELRDLFVGSLCSIAILLFCYHGRGSLENWTANVAAFAALGIALLPLDLNSDPLYQKSIIGYAHSACGGIFFLTLAYYSLHHFPTSAEITDEHPDLQRRNLIYRLSGYTILFIFILMGVYLFFTPKDFKVVMNHYNFLFWAEWISLWAFAAAWLTKGHAILAELTLHFLALSKKLIKK